MRETQTEKYHRMRLELVKQFGGKCNYAFCGEDEPSRLEFAHKKGSKPRLNGEGRGRWERLYDVKNHPKDYILLCRVHHFQYDSLLGGEHD